MGMPRCTVGVGEIGGPMALGVKPSNVWDASMQAARRWGKAYKSTEITKDELFAKIHREARDMGWSPEDATVIADNARRHILRYWWSL
jgi:hypothetical protein